MLQGREETTLKTAWDYADKVGGAADAFDKLPDHLGPVMDLVNIGIDIGECFAALSDKAALMTQITAFNKDVTTAKGWALGERNLRKGHRCQQPYRR